MYSNVVMMITTCKISSCIVDSLPRIPGFFVKFMNNILSRCLIFFTLFLQAICWYCDFTCWKLSSACCTCTTIVYYGLLMPLFIWAVSFTWRSRCQIISHFVFSLTCMCAFLWAVLFWKTGCLCQTFVVVAAILLVLLPCMVINIVAESSDILFYCLLT